MWGTFEWHESFFWLGKLVLAALLGGAVGFERETHGQAAGLRTNLLVTVGSCLMMMLSLHIQELFQTMDANSNLRIDPARIASYAVAGMGFLGGGAIIKGRGSIRGLTTAASLWMNTGVGLAIGAGYFLPAMYATVISLVILYNLRFLKMAFTHEAPTILEIACDSSRKPLHRIRELLAEHPELEVTFLNYYLDIPNDTVRYRMRVVCRKTAPYGKILAQLREEIEGLKAISWEESDVP
ncbi:MAG: MgtC/SapB family protein [Syntrophobacter sp.]